MLFYFPYTGGKRLEFKNIQHILKDSKYNKFVEPFCGSCATGFYNYYKNDKKDVEYIFNDVDTFLINLFNNIKKENGAKKYIDFCSEQMKDLTKEKHLKLINDFKKNPDNVYLFFYYNKVYNFRRGIYPTGREGHIFNYSKYKKIDDFFISDKTTFFNLDFKEILKKYENDPEAFIYLDPPYLSSYNFEYKTYKKNYDDVEEKELKIIDNTKIYIDIVNFLKNCKCSAIMIINYNAINEYIFKDFIYSKYKKKYSGTKSGTKTASGKGNYFKSSTEHLIIYKSSDN